MAKLTFILQLATLAISANAHAIFQQLYVNGVDQGHLTGIRVPDYDGPIQDVTSNDIVCNGGINPYHSPLSKSVISVPAGGQVTAEWHHTLQGKNPGDSADPIDPSHKGPIITYLAKVNDATSMTVTGLKWFKIQEEGYNPSTKQWAVDKMIANQGKYTLTIPSCIPPGDYLMRHELIALHGASSYPGAQFYMECAQLRITGGGSANPATVNFPGAYSGSDPGIKINIYGPLSSYTIPGPPVFSCGSASPPASNPPSTPTAPPATSNPPSTPTRPPATSSAPATVPPVTGGAAQYAQCGGTGFTGPTTCVSPFKCTALNEWYSQCL